MIISPPAVGKIKLATRRNRDVKSVKGVKGTVLLTPFDQRENSERLWSTWISHSCSYEPCEGVGTGPAPFYEFRAGAFLRIPGSVFTSLDQLNPANEPRA